MGSQLIVVFVVEALHRRLLYCAIHPLDLAIRPGVVWFGQAVLDPVRLADHVEAHRPGIDGIPVPGLLGELDAIVGQYGMDLVGHGLKKMLQELPGAASVGRFNELGHSELGGPVDAHEEIELALGGLHFGNVDVKEPDGVTLELLALRLVSLESGKREMPCRCRHRCSADLDGYCLNGVAAAAWDLNRLDTFVVGSDGALYHKWWDGSSWSGWEYQGGYCISAPAAVSWAPNRIDTFVIGTDHAMYHKWWDGSSWSGYENLGGYCLNGVAVASWAPNGLDTFVIGGDGAMYHKWWDGFSWSGWESQGGYCISAPAAVSWGPNRIDTFVIGTDHAMYHKWWDGSSWSDWENLGGYCLEGVAAASWAPN